MNYKDRKFLTRTEARALEDWVKANEVELERTTQSRAEVAAVASKALGFHLTEHHLKGAAETMDVKLAKYNRSAKTSPKEERILLVTLTKDYMRLCEKLGETPPAVVVEKFNLLREGIV